MAVVSAARSILTRLHDVMAAKTAPQAKLNAVVNIVAEGLTSEVCSIYLLREGALELYATKGLAQSAVSKHVACLRDCGLVDGRPVGRQVFYSLTRPELIDLLEAAEVLLQATGYQVDLCTVYGTDARAAS